MSALRKPALGPIVGHTTDKACRLWIAAADPVAENSEMAENRRTVGVIAVVDKAGQVFPDSIAYFRLQREFDRTGTFNLGRDVSLWSSKDDKRTLSPFMLEPGTEYIVRMATLSLDDPYENEAMVDSEEIAWRLPEPTVWARDLDRKDGNYVQTTIRTAPAASFGGAKTKLSFLLGSCRYPGLLWKKKLSDQIFSAMYAQKDAAFTMMVGDQIYADLLNQIEVGLADSYDEFQERYRTAFSTPNMSRLLASKPTYMILDDHEIEDNWAQDRVKKSDKRALFNLAMGFYMSYQWSHGPRFFDSYLNTIPSLSGDEAFLQRDPGQRLYYDFGHAGYPFFVIDTRTQRYRDDAPGLPDNHMLGRPTLNPSSPNQIDRLCAWLKHQQQFFGNVPKFIVTSSVFLPNDVRSVNKNAEAAEKYKNESDGWEAFPTTRRQLLQTIVEHKVQNVIFLSGDVHCSNIAQVSFSAAPELACYSVISSAFYWPFPFADGDESDFVHNSKDPRTPDTFPISETAGSMDYVAWGFTQEDNFARLDIDPASQTLSVQFYSKEGKEIETCKQNGQFTKTPEVVKLASW